MTPTAFVAPLFAALVWKAALAAPPSPLLLTPATCVSPEQFHISYTQNVDEMWVTWVRPGSNIADIPEVLQPFCTYWTSLAGPTSMFKATATTRSYREAAKNCRADQSYGGPCVPWSGLIHTALLTALPPSSIVTYSCGSVDLMSARRNFTAPPNAGDVSPVSFAIFGDQGSSMQNINGGMEQFNHTYPGSIFVRDHMLGDQSLRFLHMLGDVAYANGNQPAWDGYGRDMDPLQSTLPSLFSPGNHDGEFTYGNTYANAGEGGGDSGIAYALRYPGPGAAVGYNSSHTGPLNSTSLYWSINSGPVHLVATAGVLGFEAGTPQYTWLEADLAAASAPAARATRPWIVLTNHYQLYCSLESGCDTPAHSTKTSAAKRVGALPERFQTTPPTPGSPGVQSISPERMRKALEPLLLKYGVDAVFTGHQHSYERTHAVKSLSVTSFGLPVANGGTLYEKPGAPLYWVVGTGGADPSAKSWKNASAFPWVASQLFDDSREGSNWGWAKLEANQTTLYVQFMDSYRKLAGLDKVWITKSKPTRWYV